jgi:uncharacterized membrane protein
MVIDYYLKRWKKAELITEDQYKAIHSFEQNGPSFAIYGFSALGGFTILTGLVSLIAFNWEDIQDSVKLLLGFTLLFTAGVGAYLFQKKRVVYELLLLLYFGLILGMIGLISQVFHLSGPFYGALLLWTIPSLPLVLLARSSIVPHFWIGAFLFAITGYLDDAMHFNEEDAFFIVLSVSFQALIWISIIIQSTKTDFADSFAKTLTQWAVFTGALATILFSFYDQSHDDLEWIYQFRFQYLILSAFSVGGLLVSFVKILSKDWISAILLSVTTLFLVLFFLVATLEIDSEILDAVLFVIIWTLMGIYAAKNHKIYLFDIAVIGAGIRILIVYFQIFENMAYTGFGLILTGLLILVAVYGWFTIHKQMVKKEETSVSIAGGKML